MTNTKESDFKPLMLALALFAGVLFYLLAGLLPFPDGTDDYAPRMAAAITATVAFCWLSSAMPLGAASLLPLPLLSILGVLPLASPDKGYGSATAYAHPIPQGRIRDRHQLEHLTAVKQAAGGIFFLIF